jgi:hypothetical protein
MVKYEYFDVTLPLSPKAGVRSERGRIRRSF